MREAGDDFKCGSDETFLSPYGVRHNEMGTHGTTLVKGL